MTWLNDIWEDDFKKIEDFIPDKDAFMNTKWLITGASGMIGSYLLSFLCWLNETKLQRSMSFTITHRRDIDEYSKLFKQLTQMSYCKLIKTDLGVEFEFDDIGEFDFVIHGASNAAPRSYLADPLNTINSNVRATQLMLEYFCEQKPKSFIFISSGEIYGDAQIVPTPEDYAGITDHLQPRSCYVESKRFGETLCWNYALHKNIPIKIIRPVHVFGPGFREDDSRVWANFIFQAINNNRIEILGDGTSRRGFCYLSDAILQLLYVILRGENREVYNIGNEQHISIKELADIIAELSSEDIQITIKNQLPDHLIGSPSISCPSINKVKSLGTLPYTSVKEGLSKTYQWYCSCK